MRSQWRPCQACNPLKGVPQAGCVLYCQSRPDAKLGHWNGRGRGCHIYNLDALMTLMSNLHADTSLPLNAICSR